MNSDNRPDPRLDQPGWGEPAGEQAPPDPWGAPYGSPPQSAEPNSLDTPGGLGGYGLPPGNPVPSGDAGSHPPGLGGPVPPQAPPVFPGQQTGPFGPHGAPSGPPGPSGGPPRPPGFGPPPRRQRKKSQGLLIGGIAGGGLALILIAALIIMMVSGGSGGRSISNDEGKEAAAQLDKAGQHLANTAAAQYKGTVNLNGGQGGVEVKVTKSGSSTGSVKVDGKDVDILTIDNQTYAKGDTNFWTKQGVRSTSASAVANHWGKLDFNDSRDFQFPGTAELARTLQQITDEQVRNSEKTNLNGVQALKIYTAQGTFWITTSDPRRVVRMELSKDGSQFALDLTELGGPQLEQLYTELKEQTQKLKGARDPNVFVAASPQVAFGTRSAAGIAIKATVTPSAVGSIKAIRATMSAKMTSGSEKIGGCTGSKTIKASGSSTMTCVNRTGAWTSWFNKAQNTPGFHRYFARVSVQAYAFADADVKALVSKIDQERGGS